MLRQISARSMMPRGARSFSSKNGMKQPNLGIIGATGAVGSEFVSVIEKRGFPFNNLKLFAHPDEAGQTMEVMGKSYTLEVLDDDSFEDLDVALFSAGEGISRKFAPVAAKAGCVAIDNSSCFRMDENTPLCIPEVNPHAALKHNGIIANPNCSTIIMNVPVYPLHQMAGIERVVVSTYQAASGAGADAMAELETQAKESVEGIAPENYTQDIFGRPYIWNLFSHNSDIYADNGYNEEEWKMVVETPKIFEEAIKVAVTCIRVPVLRAHCESINMTFKRPVTLDEVYAALEAAPGIRVVDDRAANKHPEPLSASGEYDILVGRVRMDQSQPEGMGVEMFVAGDQLLKGAALNAVQCAELLLKN